MTKSELMENCTMEQLAEMVIKYQNASIENEKKTKKANWNMSYVQKCNDELEKFLKENPLQSITEKICKDIVEQKNNTMAIEFTKVICELLGENGVFIRCTETNFGETITENSIERKYGICFDGVDFSEHDKKFTDEIEELKSQLDRKQTEIKQIDEQLQHYKFAMMQVDDVLVEFFGKTHEIMDKPHEFEKILQEVIDKSKTIYNFLPTEPIDVASMLINAKGECEPLKLCGQTYKGTYKLFDISKLRQIAEHLLVYCNANESEGEE